MTKPEDLTPRENAVMLSLIRGAIRKNRRSYERGLRRFGIQYDSSRHKQRTEVLEGLYIKFGGDPKRITDRAEKAG